MCKDRDSHLYTVGILIIAIALMMFTENKSSCSFPALNTVLALLSGLFSLHAVSLVKNRKDGTSSDNNKEV